ncbi:hypothetical protein [Adhaeribacter pallidiroseus]|uniref:Outer membrane lipoprotein-sorting protein n=1 Tax=Adhaeribacter pallidiroseus TaxID=2072847 RepID=A0A369QBB6_9BACT|nr:hypothetical protein [Adhaeribacter pallidiroseus]RDC61620.1 hypothetical protein AHMF7616_00200 [Adhaeribacter pallidiroseus]
MFQKTTIWFLRCFLILLPGYLLAQNATNASDERAIVLADKVIKNMGGIKNWNNTRFIAWSWLGQYHIWDKYENKFRYEKDTLVVISDLNTKKGTVYSKGKVLPDTAKSREILNKQYAVWANNSYWLLMPFKLRDKGVTLKYTGEGKTQTGAAVDLIELTFKEVGVTPNNRYVLGIDKNAGLVTEWSFFRNATDEKPAFTRPWTEYKKYGKIKIASSRGDEKMRMQDIVVSQNVNSDLFNSPTPVNKELVK